MNTRDSEIEKRRLRARSEAFTIARVPSPVVERFIVKSTRGRAYQIVIDRQMNLKTCECHDFLNAGLGTCKHIEAVLIRENIPSSPATMTASVDPVLPAHQEVSSELFSTTSSSTGRDAKKDQNENLRHLVCFDVETQNSFDDVGGRQNFSKLRVSVAVLYDELLNQYFVYNEHEASQLIEHLFSADVVVGYNILGFDYAVIQPYSIRDVKKLPTLDLMAELVKSLGFRVGLDSVVHATLGARKSAHGLQAIEWFRAGEMEKLTRYCQDDVRLTYELFRFGATNGFVYINSRGSRQRVLVNWK